MYIDYHLLAIIGLWILIILLSIRIIFLHRTLKDAGYGMPYGIPVIDETMKK